MMRDTMATNLRGILNMVPEVLPNSSVYGLGFWRSQIFGGMLPDKATNPDNIPKRTLENTFYFENYS